MKVLIVGDIHWSTYSSIVRSRGKNFSTRLEYLIKSLSWVEQVAKEKGCEEEIFLGDTFDKPELSSEELTALSEIEWNTNTRLKHFIVGNHESGVSSLIYNSTQALHKVGVIEDTPYIYPIDEKTEILFLPYIVEDDRKSLVEYLKGRDVNKRLIICSHNDIKDFQMGMFLSKTGFSIDEIENNCDLYINGHLHNGGWVTKKILNLGVLCGQNFSEDAFKYEHHIAILDTNTLELEFIENPYALNFYKINIDKEEHMNKLNLLKNNAVVTIKCLDTLEEKLRKVLESHNNIIEYRVIQYSNITSENVEEIKINNVDHLEQFKNFCIDKLGLSGITNCLIEELNEVCK